MKINTLEMFVKLIDMGSYSLVAENMDLTQPAVSMQIKNMEERFSTELVIKENGEMKLTPAGKIVYNQAKNILNNWEQMLFNINEVQNKTYGELKIGSSTIPSEYLLPKYISQYSAKLPKVKVYIEVGDSEDMIEQLEDRNVDIIIIGKKPDNFKFKTTPITDDFLQLIVPSDHHLAQLEEVAINDLKSEKMLIREEGSGTRKAMLEGLKRLAAIDIKDLNIICRLGSTEAVISAVESGLGISFVSSLAAEKAEKFNRVSIVKVSNLAISRKFYLAFNKRRWDELLIKKFTNLF
jgi:DNA-binding transcriptional LysR family regulator